MIRPELRPSPAQENWHRAAFGVFFHFGINTFYGKEWSDGTLSPDGFDPTRFDAAQWVEVVKEAGAGYVILTAKHHDGFCLWPSDTTRYSVASSPFRGDVVGNLARACQSAGMPLGLYLSPWDRNASCYADTSAYDDFYCAQLRELCTRYGQLFELWFDGAGSEGRQYNWDKIMGVAEQYQPDALIFNMGRPTIRWVGNEDGVAADPVYYVAEKTEVSAFSDASESLGGDVAYLPPECDVAIRQNWFWQEDDLPTLKSQQHLEAIWYRSIGLGANLLLNLGPNREGLLDSNDTARLLETTNALRQRFAAPVRAKISPLPDGFALDFGRETRFDHLELRENLANGQRIDGWEVRLPNGKPVAQGKTIGAQRWEVFPAVSTSTLHVKLGRAGAPDAQLTEAAAFQTGVEERPSLGKALDYREWAQKADAR